MRITDHVEKAARIEASMRRLNVDQDYETVIENCMLAGTHLLNAILHRIGITSEDEDLLHSDKPQVQFPDDPDLLSAVRAMKHVEDLRPRFLRGVEAYSPEVGRSSLEAYDVVKRVSVERLADLMA